MQNGPHLRAREVQVLLAALDRLYFPVSLEEFPTHLFGVLAELLPGTVSSFDFVDLSSGQAESHIAPLALAGLTLAELEARVRAHLWQHPVLAHWRGGPLTEVLQPTDLISQRQFRRTDFYELCFRPTGIEYQIAAGLAWPGHVGGFTVNRPRPRNFTGLEVALVQHLRPHVERAFAAALRAATPPAPQSLVVDGLTRRQGEVLHWLGVGKRNAEIAVILGISSRTVDKHVEHVLSRLGVETRSAAAATLAWGAAWEDGRRKAEACKRSDIQG